MRVGIIQSCYIPWRGYFDFIDSVDLFIFHDDLQYTKGDWRNRNRIKTLKGMSWLTVPVHYYKVEQLILNTEIDYSRPWPKKHLAQIQANYRCAPYISDVIDIMSTTNIRKFQTISELNIFLIKQICHYLNITTPLILSSELKVNGKKTERLIEILKKVNASTYLSGRSADDYLEKSMFIENGISLEYKAYDYPEYGQLWNGYHAGLSIIDLIANQGPGARDFISSLSPNQIIIP
ncbi:MAG: WbqC family protein [Pseudomonadota bacterium]|uniref:WbqC family protein n=1 Tax=Methylophaga aminisulfidivorans TaxID=230105 RepID=UPI0024E25001|nr:WbqC family protein [Methylophaga aminisulfidivorans]MEC9413351.1 WbqC family protein [Pseudomonadota bacterium]